MLLLLMLLGKSLAQPQQKSTAFTMHFANVNSDENCSADFHEHKVDFESEHTGILSSSSDYKSLE